MLTQNQRFVISIIRKSLGIKDDFDSSISDSDTNEIIQIILKNGILLTVFPTLPEKIQLQLKMKYNASLKQAILQEYEGKAVLSDLSNSGMNCIALKGWELRKLYPDTTMRQMADLDILVKPYDFEKLRPIMDKLDFDSGSESSWKHDNFTKGKITVEMHKRLTDDSGIIQKWESQIWDRAEKVDGHIYK